MHVTNYQIHNVLKIYINQLNKERSVGRAISGVQQTSGDSISISAEGKRRNMIDNIAADIVSRITHYGPGGEFDRKIVDQLQNEIDGIKAGKEEERRFVYNVVHSNEEKETNALSTEDADLLTQRLEELAKETVGRHMGTAPED